MKEYREAALSGRYPYLPVLDDILQNANVEAQLPIGIVEVPLKLVVGTKTAGRTAAFSYNFMPLLGTGTEFSVKWITPLPGTCGGGHPRPHPLLRISGQLLCPGGQQAGSAS